MPDPWDDVAGVDPADDAPSHVTFNGVAYTPDEALRLVAWLSDAVGFGLLDRYFAHRRTFAIDAIDSGSVRMDSAEELVRQSATCGLIYTIRHMAAELDAQLKALQTRTENEST